MNKNHLLATTYDNRVIAEFRHIMPSTDRHHAKIRKENTYAPVPADYYQWLYERQRGLISEYVHSQLAYCNQLFTLFIIIVTTISLF